MCIIYQNQSLKINALIALPALCRHIHESAGGINFLMLKEKHSSSRVNMPSISPKLHFRVMASLLKISGSRPFLVVSQSDKSSQFCALKPLKTSTKT